LKRLFAIPANNIPSIAYSKERNFPAEVEREIVTASTSGKPARKEVRKIPVAP
jgi:hypothetical protein